MHRGDLRIAGEAAQRNHVGRGVVFEQPGGLRDKPIDDRRGALRLWVGAAGGQRRHAGLLRIGVVDGVAQIVAAEDDDEAVLPHRLDEDFDIRHTDRLELAAHGDATLGRRAAGAAIGDPAGFVHGAEIAAGRHVARPDLKMDAQGLENAPANAMLERIVAE